MMLIVPLAPRYLKYAIVFARLRSCKSVSQGRLKWCALNRSYNLRLTIVLICRFARYHERASVTQDVFNVLITWLSQCTTEPASTGGEHPASYIGCKFYRGLQAKHFIND
ncbi:hypothetical protein J6590_065901 [Homalodisca vitripennis]|nr:hypothetical protein J6590_065901 [Homalodisca vitripennis]